jgi:hypothetical protein
MQLSDQDFSDWRLVDIRPPVGPEAPTKFYDILALRSAKELVIGTPHPGFFTTPAFFANWSTNQSNQMRVTANQALIVATGKQIDGTDLTHPASTPGLDAAHAATDSACYGCHKLLDPTRAILQSTYTYAYSMQQDPTLMEQKGTFAFDGVVTDIASIDDFARTLATHPAVPRAWAQKLCYYLNSAPCADEDPELLRVIAAFSGSNLSWNALVRTLATSPLITNARITDTARQNGEVVAVARRDHLCAALDHRLGLTDVCALDVGTKSTIVSQIADGLPSDGYGRGATAPVLPNQPSLFYRAGMENVCAAVAAIVVDPAATAAPPGARHWTGTDPDTAIADFTTLLMSLTSSDPRAAPAKSLLRAHYDAAVGQKATKTDALRSTVVTACLSPGMEGVGM